MPDTKQYFISLPGFEDLGRWDVQTYEKKKHELFKKYPDAQIFEFSKYNADEEQGENDYYHIQLDGLEGEGVWDAKTFAEKKDKLFQKYPNAQVYRSRGVDYWYDKALADEESIKTMKEELEALTKEEYALPEEASVNPYDPELSPKEYEEFERQYTAHEQGRQSRKDHLAASIAETQEAYDANPRVIEANERYEAEYAAALEEYKKNYLPNLRKQITDWKEEEVDEEDNMLANIGEFLSAAVDPMDRGVIARGASEAGYDTGAAMKVKEKVEQFDTGLAFLDKAERLRKEHSSFTQGFSNWAQGVAESKMTQSDLDAYTEIYTILQRLEKELGHLNNISEETLTQHLSKSEQALILGFFEYNAAQAEVQDSTRWEYKAGQITGEAIPFILEFIATGGLTKSATKGATKGLSKALTSWIKGATKGSFRRTARKVVAKGVRGAAQGLTQAAMITPLRPTAYTNVTKAMTQIGEDGKLKDSASDIAIAVADEYIETLSELSGGAISSVLGGIAKGTASKLLSKGAYETFESWGKKLASLSGVKLLKRGQFHGLPVEMAEEYFGNALREMYDAKALDRMHEGDNFWSMFFGFMPLTVIGGGLGIGQYVNAQNKVNKGAKRLRDILAKEGYEGDQINSLLALEGELSPYSLAEKLDPVLTSMAAAGASKESRDAVIKYGIDVVRLKTLEGTVRAQDATKRQEKLDELTGKLGTFYQTKNEGTQWQENVVTQATLFDGRTVFLTSAKNEMGEFAAVDAETGEIMPVSESDIAVIENTNTGESSLAVESQSLDSYLTSLVMGERKAAEEARMADEENTQIAALQERLKADPKVNIGTSDAPVIAVFQSGNANMAEFVLEDGSTKLLSWREVGDYLNQPIRVLTDEQLAEAEAAEMEVEEAMMRTEYAETNEEMDMADESAELAMESEEKANPVNIPMNPDGTVNTDLFWDQNPEEWVKWNDQQRQDNGVDSMAQIAAGLQTAEAKLSEASKLPFATPTQREARDKEMGFWQDKINRYNALLEQYQLAAAAEEAQMARAYAAERLEAAEAALADKMTQAPKRSDYRFTPQYMQAKQKFDAEVASLQEEVTRWQNELAQYGEAPVQQEETAPVENVSVVEEQQPEEVAPSAEELAAQLDAMLMAGASRSDEAVVTAMQAYADAIASGVPAQVVTRKNVMQVLKDAGVSETKMAEVKGALRRIQYIVNGFEANGVAYMLAEGVISSEHLRGTYVHERQHIMTAVSGIDAALMTMTSREELQEAIAKLTNSNFYEGKGHMVLADELISMAMERAYKGENLDEVFEQIGFKNENAINFIKDIDNAQRNDSGLSLARVAGIGGNAAEGGSRQDGRTALSGSTEVGEQGPRSVGRGGETTGDNTSGRGVGFSVSPDEGVAGMIENESGDAIAETNGGGGVRFSVLTYEQGGRDYLVNWLRKSKYMSKEERDFIIATLDQQYELAKRLGKEFPAFGAWSSAEVNVDKDGNPVMSVIKANGDYSMNLDFSLICKKRRPLNALLDVMIADRMLDMRSLNEAEIAKINKVIQRHGFEVACALCFVDSKRYRVVKVATDFADLYNELVNSLIPEGSGIEAVESNYAGYEYINERNAEKTGRRLETVPDAELNWAKVDEILEGVKTPKSVEEKVAWLLRNNPSQRKLVNATDFVTNLGFESVKKNNPELLKIYNAKKGTGGPKASFGDVQYLNDILKSKSFTPAKAYSVGGVRVQSFSDYMGHMFFDYMQMMAELSAKGLPAHAYTKEEAFARIFGMTGMKINMSLVPAVADDGVAPGLDAQGNYVWAVPYTDENGNEIQGQTFPPDVAFELQRDPRYSKNVGIIAVGVSDEHILKMLNDDQIHFVIPYHKSSLNPEVAKLTKIDKYADYTNVQNTRLGWEFANLDKDQKKAELKKRAFDFYKSLAKTKDPKATAAEYLEHCRQNGLIPKYDQFSGHENYYKLLVDFNTYDFNTGEYAPQGPVTMTFPEELESLVKASVASNEELESDLKDKVGKMAEDVKAELGETRFSVSSKNKSISLQNNGNNEQNGQAAVGADTNGEWQANGSGVVGDTAGIVERNRDRSDIRVLEQGLESSRAAYSDDSERTRREAESERLVDLAKKNNLYIPLKDTESLGEKVQKRTGESVVYIDEETGRVFKVKDPYAKSAMKTGVEPEDAIYEHVVHNLVFPETPYKFVGISDKLGDVRIVLSQDYVESASRPTKEQIAEALASKGLMPETAYSFGNDLISVTDVEGDNVLLGEDGTVYFIDPIIRFKKPAEEVIESLSTRFSARTDEQRQALFDKAKAQFGLTNNFNAAGYMLPDGSLLDFSEANDGGNPNQRSQDHREIEGIIMDEGKEYDSRWMYLADFMNEGAIRLLPEYAGINLMKAPTKEQRQRLFDFIYKYNGEVILEIADERLNNVAYVEYDRRTSPSRIFRDIDGYFNKGIVPQQDTRFSASNNNQEIFVSNAAKAVEGIKQEKATPAQWLAMLEKNGGLKAAEDKWIGLSDWLKESDKKSLTKAEVLDFINEHMIVIEEQHYGDFTSQEREDATFENLKEKYGEDFTRRLVGEAFIYEEGVREPYLSVNDPIEAISLYYEETGEEIRLDEDGLLENEDYDKLVKWAESVIRNASEIDRARQINSTRLHYTTDGLENLHEIALTVPTIEAWEEKDEVHFGDAGDGRAVAWIRFGDTNLPVEKDYQAAYDAAREGYKALESSLKQKYNGAALGDVMTVEEKRAFWDAFEKMLQANGELLNPPQSNTKVLVIDEIQSKRHQEGRERGYMPIGIRNVQLRMQEIEERLEELGRIESESDFGLTDEQYDEQILLLAEQKELVKSGTIPDAPFEKNWHELAMKRMLRYAAENGYDYIAWTKGAQQAERYNIGNYVSSIEMQEEYDGNRDFGFYMGDNDEALTVTVDENGTVVSAEDHLSQAEGRPLADLVGKEMAVKMMQMEEYDVLEDTDLNIGNKGMEGFYDKMLPAFMNKYGKKWGIKVEDINLPNLEDGLTMHSVPITEEMKASVMEGQTMFSVRTPAENKYTKEHLPNYMFDTDVRFSLSKNNRQTINGWLNKRGDLTEEVKTEVLDLLDQYNDATLQLCMGKWFAQGVISLPEDIDKCIQAVASAKKAKVNALSYPSPMSIIDQHGVIEKKQKPIDPDTVSTLKKSKVMDDGVVLYDVEESEESRQNLREIINTHYGANSSPWCLLQGDENGKLTEKSAGFWNEYSAVPKRVAFKDGKLLAFYASRSNQTTPWWDRFDRPWEGVPVSSKDKNDPLKREITRLVDDKTGKAGDEVSIIREEKFSDGSRAVAEWASMDPNDIRSYEKKTSSGRVTAGFEYQRVLAEPGNPAFRFFANIFNRAIPKRLSWVSHNGESVQMDSMLGLTEYSMNDVSIDYTGDNISVVQVENYEENGEPRKYAKIYYDFSKSGNLVEAGVRDEQKEWVIITDKEELAQYEEQARPYFDMAKSAMEDPYKKMEEIKDRILDEAGLRFSVALNPEVRQEMDIIKATAMVNGNYMKAPNGQPTKLTEDQWALVRTNNFKRWFGDWENDPENASKVVDENGEPMVVYHGTAGSINKFENQQRSPGFWFVDREDVANGYAESASTEFEKEKNVVPVFLNIRNPRMEDARGEYPAEFALKSFVENDNGVYEVFDTYEEAEAYQKQNVPDGWIGAAEVGDQNDLVERAKEFGYDGVIMKNMHDQAAYAETRVKGPQTNYVALNPNQIKSATETTGLFSENEDIRFSAIVPHESSMDEIDQMFASLNRDPFVRDLYAKVSELAHKMNLKIKFVEPWSEAGGANILDKVKYNVDYFNSNDYAQTKAGVLLHELIHSVTVYAVAAKNSSVLTQEMKDAVKQMEAIYDEIKDDPAFDGTYGAESVKEMVSELSNPRFRQKLRAKNLFQRIIDAIKQLLGIDKGTNALDNLEGTLEYMIENFDQNAFDAVLKANEQSDYYTRFSVRTKPAPKEVKRAYKLFNVDGEGKPHALFIDGANALDEKVWYDADSPLIKDLENLESGYTYYVDKDGNAERKSYKNKKQSPSKEELADAAAKGGRYIYVGTYANGEKSYYNWGVNGGKNGGSVSQFAMRPGWHLTDSPSARHIGAGRNPEAKQEAMYRKPNQRWFEVEYAADVDYNEEAKANPTGDIQTHIPEDGYYSFKTNTAANDVNQNWIISGAIRIVKPLTREEVSKLNEKNGVPDDLDYENGTMFSVSERSVDEIVNDGVQKVSEEGKKAKASLKQRMDDIDSKLYYVMRMVAAAQKNYDKKTVDIMTNLAKDLMRDGALSDPTRGEINRLLAAIKNATGKADLTAAATTLMDVMVSNQLRHAKNTLAQMLKIKAKKVNASGVEAQGTLDLVGQRLIATVKESVGLTLEKIDERIADAKEKMDSEFDTIKNNAAIDLVGLNIARKYVDDVVASEAEEKDLRKELESAQEDKKAGKMTAGGLREFRKATEDAIRQNRIERTGAYRNILSEMAKLITESVTKAGQFRDAEKERVEKIHHYANSDLKGLPADAHTMKESAFWNSNIVRFFLKPLSSFEQMLKHFGSKNAEGKGYLYNHFIPGWVEASNKEFSGTMEAYSQLDAKAREVFGGKVKRWSDLFAVEKKRPAMTVKIWDDNKIKEYELSQGNLLYIYMVNKMTDGKMKLRKMGITEEDVRSIYNNLDPRFIEIAEWIQNDFLPSLRDKCNAVHERMFGAPMAAIDNYFPIRVLANARTRDVEVGTPEGNSNPSTITGNIIKRTKNSLALDVLGSDAFDVVLEHIQQMEHWAAFAEWNRDLNTLLSYKKFRNRVQNMSGIYGAGAKAWEEFRATAEIAAGVYRPKVSSMDKILNKVVRGLTAGKIGFRLWTAMKQILSAPAFAPYASPANILKNMVMPKASWDWAMENLEGFNKRWKSRDMGNVRLKKNASGIERWTDDWMDTMTRIGMTPNAFVDAVTCAIGAKSVYETAYAKYEEQGYSAEDAKKKAMVDATVAFNTTQQSGEGAFLSSLQADRDMVAYMTTTYRNANFGMGREFFDAARNLKHRMTPGYKEESLEFMTKQMMRDGLSEAKAKRAAERVYRNGIFKDSARVVTFGFVMQFLWNMGNSVIYQLFGDDDEDKKQMTEDAAFRALFGPIENLTFGNVILDGVMMAREGDMAKFNPSLSPAGQDLTRLIETLSTDPIAGVSDLVNIIFQSAIGTNPQVAADIALAIYDACDGDMETSKEVGIALLRILQAPQSQIDKLIEDEIDFTKDKGFDLTIEEFARRYAEYKRKKNAPYSFFLYSDEEERKVEDRYIKRFTKRAEELKRTRGNEEAKAWYNYVDNEYEEVSGTINELRRKAQKAAMRGDTLSAYEFAEQLNEFLNTPEVKRYEERAGRVKGEEKIRKAMKDMPQNRDEFEDIALQLRKELVEEMQLSE